MILLTNYERITQKHPAFLQGAYHLFLCFYFHFHARFKGYKYLLIHDNDLLNKPSCYDFIVLSNIAAGSSSRKSIISCIRCGHTFRRSFISFNFPKFIIELFLL